MNCVGTIAAVGRGIRGMHECGLHARAVLSWPDPGERRVEIAETTARFDHHKHMVFRALFDMIHPIESILGIHEEVSSMSGEHVGNLGYFQSRLPRALAVVERKGRNVPESELEASIETLAALLDHSLRQVAAPGLETTLVPAGRMAVVGGVTGINVDDDRVMISHLNRALSSGVFAPPVGARADRAGAPLPSSRIPQEDAGRTAHVVGGPDPTVISPAANAPTIPGLDPSIMQHLPTAVWLARKLVELIGQWRSR